MLAIQLISPKMWLFYPVAENNINWSQYGPDIHHYPSISKASFYFFSSEDQ